QLQSLTGARPGEHDGNVQSAGHARCQRPLSDRQARPNRSAVNENRPCLLAADDLCSGDARLARSAGGVDRRRDPGKCHHDQRLESIHIWNHNQANLTDRGFRRTRLLGSVDGASWFALTATDVIELPRASGSPGLEAIVISNVAPARALQSVVLAAEPQDGNYGSDYYGLSAVRFGVGREVA